MPPGRKQRGRIAVVGLFIQPGTPGAPDYRTAQTDDGLLGSATTEVL